MTNALTHARSSGDTKAASAQVLSVARKGRLRRVRKATLLLQSPAWRRAALRGVAAAVEHRRVPFGLDLATVVDVGAHHGQFALLARELYPDADVICVEPLAQAQERLWTIHGRDNKVRIMPFAAGETHRRDTLHVSNKTDSSSLRPILGPYVAAFPGTEESREVEVDVRPLDALVQGPVRRPALLKIDVQGGELDVLRGATALLAQIDVAFVECSFVEFYGGQALADQVIAVLATRGLRLVGVYSVVRDAGERCLQADMLFRRAPSEGDHNESHEGSAS